MHDDRLELDPSSFINAVLLATNFDEKEAIDSEAENNSYFGLGQNTFLGNFADGLYKVASGHNLNDLLGAKPQGRGRT